MHDESPYLKTIRPLPDALLNEPDQIELPTGRRRVPRRTISRKAREQLRSAIRHRTRAIRRARRQFEQQTGQAVFVEPPVSH